MVDTNYAGKVHSEGPDRQAIEDAGEQRFGSTTYTGAELEAFFALLAGIPAENVAAPAIWNDAGTLKLGTLGD